MAHESHTAVYHAGCHHFFKPLGLGLVVEVHTAHQVISWKKPQSSTMRRTADGILFCFCSECKIVDLLVNTCCKACNDQQRALRNQHSASAAPSQMNSSFTSTCTINVLHLSRRSAVMRYTNNYFNNKNLLTNHDRRVLKDQSKIYFFPF